MMRPSLMLILLILAGCSSERVLNGVQYSSPEGQPLLLDVYLPEGKGPHPVLLVIHGGGWMFGARSDGYWIGKGFSKIGYAVVSIDYRYSNVSDFPAQLEDCTAAIDWIEGNRDRYGLNDHIGVVGASAGGHLAALMAEDPRVDAVVDIAGPADMENINDQCLSRNLTRCDELRFLIHELLGCDPAECPDKAIAASPVSRLTGQAAPMLILHGDNDQIVPVDQAIALSKVLERNGVEHKLEIIPGQGHELNMSTIDILEFFESHLR